ncbi:hypothetical protein [Streptomyces avidinii]
MAARFLAGAQARGGRRFVGYGRPERFRQQPAQGIEQFGPPAPRPLQNGPRPAAQILGERERQGVESGDGVSRGAPPTTASYTGRARA